MGRAALSGQALMAKLLPFNESIAIPPEHEPRRQARRLAHARRCGVTLEQMENYIAALRAMHARRDAAANRARVTKLRLVRGKRSDK